MISKVAKESDLISGQGADEMFGGYNRYLEMDAETLEKNLSSDIIHVLETGPILDRKIAAVQGKQVHHPFLDPDVVRVSMSIPCSEKIKCGVRKAVLRDVANELGLGIIASRPKKAAQYGSGFMKVMKADAKKRGVTMGEYVRALRSD